MTAIEAAPLLFALKCDGCGETHEPAARDDALCAHSCRVAARHRGWQVTCMAGNGFAITLDLCPTCKTPLPI